MQQSENNQQEGFKRSNNPTRLETSMNDLLGEIGMDDTEEVQYQFEELFHLAIREKMRLKINLQTAFDIKDFTVFDQTVKFFIYLQRVIRNMYVTLEEDA